MALKPCLEPRCPRLVTHGRCPVHARAYEQRRGTRQQRGYDERWRRARAAFLQEFPLCGMRPCEQAPVMSRCWEQGRLTPAQQVDHVIPHRGHDGLFWDRDGNWQALCAACGGRKSQAGL